MEAVQVDFECEDFEDACTLIINVTTSDGFTLEFSSENAQQFSLEEYERFCCGDRNSLEFLKQDGYCAILRVDGMIRFANVRGENSAIFAIPEALCGNLFSKLLSGRASLD